MKKVILTIAVVLFSIAGVNAQKVTTDAQGNYVAVKRDFAREEAKETGKTYTDLKGVKYPVMESAGGKLFVVKTSKAGNEYRMYLKMEQDNNSTSTN